MARLTWPDDRGSGMWRHGFGWVERGAFAIFAGGLVLFVATRFYGAEELQIFYSAVRGDSFLPGDDWSAPLDDVFIHFDFARQAARGHPFEWSPGNGYSSGGTSLLYPLLLAPGFWFGFRDTRIMHFAAVLACVSVLAVLLGSRRLFRELPPAAKYLAPPALLGIGALDWSLFSGMEVAFFLAVWALALVAWDDLVHGEPGRAAAPTPLSGAFALGFANAVVVATRPEGMVVVLVLSLTAARAIAKRHGVRAGANTFALSGLCRTGRRGSGNSQPSPHGGLVGGRRAREARDERSAPHASGGVGRLGLPRALPDRPRHGPPRGRRSRAWISALGARGASVRVREDAPLRGRAVVTSGPLGALGRAEWPGALAKRALHDARARVATPFGGARRRGFARPRLRCEPARASLPRRLGGIGARRSVRAGREPDRSNARSDLVLRPRVTQYPGSARENGSPPPERPPSPHRVLVGDAGAIPYASDIPALDIVGLGGYPGLSFARASRLGVAAAVELIERIPPDERPDVLAIYPGWWGDFPLWFGHPAFGVSVRGNVICGGLTKMVYSANWRALDFEQRPNLRLAPGDEKVDAIDFGDIVSEPAHRYRIAGAPGFVAMKLLESPERESGELWDAGRVVPPGASVEFSLDGFAAGKAARILVRTAPTAAASLRVRANGRDVGELALRAGNRWQEAFVEVPAAAVTPRIVFSIGAERGEVVLYHLWGVQRR